MTLLIGIALLIDFLSKSHLKVNNCFIISLKIDADIANWSLVGSVAQKELDID